MTRPPGERHRDELPMIDRPPRRILDDGCLGCGLSTVSCAANREMQTEPCCSICRHDTH